LDFWEELIALTGDASFILRHKAVGFQRRFSIKPEEVEQLSDWQRVIDFHGHACCILAIGYKAAKLALSLVGEAPKKGEQPVTLV